MSIADTVRPEVARVPSQRARQCPPTVPTAYFDNRRWSWRSGICAAVEHRFEVLVEDGHDLVRHLEPVTAPLRAFAPGTSLCRYRVVRQHNADLPYGVYCDQDRLMLAGTPEGVVRRLTWHINQQMVARTTRTHVVLHSAAATRAGVTVMLPGDMEHGKTTTVAGLLREGYGYVTDEAVAISPGTLRVTPFPKALSIDDGAWHLFPHCRPGTAHASSRQWQVPAEYLASRPVRSDVPAPRVVVFPKYVAGSATELSPLTRAEALRELVQATFHFRQDAARNLHTLGRVLAGASAARLRIGSLDEAVMAVEQMVSQTIWEEM